MTVAQALNGLHLHENVELADALEFFLRGYIACADTENLGHVPLSCADQALRTFAQHQSWGDDAGSFPWERLDRAWKDAAMRKLVHHVHEGYSLSDRVSEAPLHTLPVPGPGDDDDDDDDEGEEEDDDDGDVCLEASIEEVEDDEEGDADSVESLSYGVSIVASFEDRDDSDYSGEPSPLLEPGPRSKPAAVDMKTKGNGMSFKAHHGANHKGEPNPFSGVKRKVKAAMTKTPTKSGTPLPLPRSDLPYELPFELPSSGGDEASPSQTAAVHHSRQSGALAASGVPSASSSPLTSLASSVSKEVLAAPAYTSNRRQTRSVTRAGNIMSAGSSPNVAPVPAGYGRVTKNKKTTPKKPRQRRETAAANADKMWRFIDILDARVNGADVQYRIKWIRGPPTWQPSLDLEDSLEAIAAFHEKHPEKPGPPDWFARGVARAAAVEAVEAEE
ncbi:unnamed protein product [Discula destructiva]